jgi:hypothetical protein
VKASPRDRRSKLNLPNQVVHDPHNPQPQRIQKSVSCRRQQQPSSPLPTSLISHDARGTPRQAHILQCSRIGPLHACHVLEAPLHMHHITTSQTHIAHPNHTSDTSHPYSSPLKKRVPFLLPGSRMQIKHTKPRQLGRMAKCRICLVR